MKAAICGNVWCALVAVVFPLGCSNNVGVNGLVQEQGMLQELVAVSESVNVKDAVLLNLQLGATRREISVEGALLRYKTKAGQIYLLRIAPECRYSGKQGIRLREIPGTWAVTAQAIGEMNPLAFSSNVNRDGAEWTLVPGSRDSRDTKKGERLPLATEAQCKVKGRPKPIEGLKQELRQAGVEMPADLPADTHFLEVTEVGFESQ